MSALYFHFVHSNVHEQCFVYYNFSMHCSIADMISPVFFISLSLSYCRVYKLCV